MTPNTLILAALLCGVLASQDTDKNHENNAVVKSNEAPYERTFMKYHHRRKINSYISSDYNDYDYYEPLDVYKRNAEPETLNEITNIPTESQINAQIDDSNKIDFFDTRPTDANFDRAVKTVKKDRPIGPETSDDSIKNEEILQNLGKPHSSVITEPTVSRLYNVKAAMLPTHPTTTEGPKNICIHKYHKVAQSEKISLVVGTHSPDERDYELVASDRVEPPPRPYNTTLPDGSTALVEECATSCFSLWLPGENGTDTVLGQGCWQWSMGYGAVGCGGPACTGGPAKLPGANFCCCSGDYCNHNMSVAPPSLDHVIASPKASSTRTLPAQSADFNWSMMAAYLTVAVVTIFVLAAVLRTAYTRCRGAKEHSEGMDIEKAAGMGCHPDALATGLLCVDNLTLIEHIGQGKFGSVWRGALGSTPVAVKLYANAAHWQREATLYCTPLLSHPNILKYYGSDSRPTLTEGGGRQHLIVVELCVSTLRQRLQASPLTWQQFATLAHGLASAVAHLHNVQNVNGVHKPCIVHRDVNSNNVLVSADGRARLADLGLAQTVQPADAQPRTQRITEAGTLRYLAPEALEGALDLVGARAALCAVDVFALGLVLWEMLWRTSGAHAGPAPPYAQPYAHAGLHREPTLTQMQALVPRNKARPPLPRGPVTEPRALKLAADTCEECWDHDAEARLTAVCVAERLSELKQLVTPQAHVIHDNNLHPAHGHPDSAAVLLPSESDKNSNCLNLQPCNVTTPLLYTQPHIGRNPCLERNTHTNIQNNTLLVHKSLKDVAQEPVEKPRIQNNQETCLSVARVNLNRVYAGDNERSDRLNEIRLCPRPLDYVPNDVSSQERLPKQTNLMQDVKIEKPKWAFTRLFGKKKTKNAKCDTEVKLLEGNGGPMVQNGKFKTSIVNDGTKKANVEYVGRPSNLTIENESMSSGYNFESPCTVSPPNRTLSPTMLIESQMNQENKVFAYKELPLAKEEHAPNQIFAVIVPKTKCNDSYSSNLIEMHSKNESGSSYSIHKPKVFSSQSLKSVSAGHSESDDSTFKKKCLSCDDKIIITNNSGSSSRASMEMELQYMGDNVDSLKDNDSRSFDINTDISSSSEDENLMLLSENGTKITMQPIPRSDSKKYQNDVLKEVSFCNKFPKTGYAYFDNEFSDPHDKENLNGCVDNPVYLAALNGEFSTSDLKVDLQTGVKFAHTSPKISQRECKSESYDPPKSQKPSLKYLSIKRQRSLEQVSEIFSSSGDLSHLQNPAGRVKTPGDLPVAVRRARRDRALQKGRSQDSNRLSLYDDRMMFGNSL